MRAETHAHADAASVAAALPGLVVRRVVPSDWPALRALRLEALHDTPIGFLETAEQAGRAPDDAWRARTRRGAAGGDSLQVLAWLGSRPVATAVGFLADGAAWLGAVYLAPDVRGAGLLDLLADRVAGWGREQGCTELRLEVHEDNLRAQRAYTRLGFAPTGRRRPYPLDPARDALLLVRPL